MASFASYLIVLVGWRHAYTILALPLLVLVMPAVTLIVRTRPASAGRDAGYWSKFRHRWQAVDAGCVPQLSVRHARGVK